MHSYKCGYTSPIMGYNYYVILATHEPLRRLDDSPKHVHLALPFIRNPKPQTLNPKPESYGAHVVKQDAREGGLSLHELNNFDVAHGRLFCLESIKWRGGGCGFRVY